MQIDFHHTATYSIARLAGFSHPEARTIAYAAQYVDDAVNEGVIRFTDGQSFDHIASAHAKFPTNLATLESSAENLDNTLNAEAWLPFHFLPGNLGLPAGEGLADDMIRRLVCTTDSPVAAALCRSCLAARQSPNWLHRLGVTSHVYVDTWVHKDFLGLNHPFNRVKRIFHEGDGLEGLAEDLEAEAALALPIGHGPVLLFPDQPFRSWGFEDHDGVIHRRVNPDLFMQASERLLAFYHEGLGQDPGVPMSDLDRAVLAGAFAGFLDRDGEVRHQAWMDLLAQGPFSFGRLTPQELEDLTYIPKGVGSWKWQALGTEAEQDDPDARYLWTPAFATSDWKAFHEALKAHRAEVLDTLLPTFQLDPAKA